MFSALVRRSNSKFRLLAPRSNSVPLLTRGFSSNITVDNPFLGSIYAEIPQVTADDAAARVDAAAAEQKKWARTSLDERIQLCKKFVKAMQNNREEIVKDIAGMMGRPVRYGAGELNGMAERAEAMMELAPSALADDVLPEKEGFFRTIRHEPVGVVLCIAPWNYPLLTAVNCIVPAILAGNSVLLKHSSRTPLCGDHFVKAFLEAGAPQNLIQTLPASHSVTADVMMRPEVGYAHFTGSVGAGHTIYQQAARRFIDVGLELGGKDAAYVRADADVQNAVENLVDGAMFNAGQSCCGVERVYVARPLYEDFLSRASAFINKDNYVLGDPFDTTTTHGPMADPKAPAFLEGQIKEAVESGARLLVGGKATSVDGKGRFFEPTLIADCDHSMRVMTEESFGPIMAVAPVDSDAQAIELINDSEYGLTASLWTQSKDREEVMGLVSQIEAGTVFMNRCDYLDPLLAWTGVKDTGKGVSLSKHGFGPLTRLKSVHLKL